MIMAVYHVLQTNYLIVDVRPAINMLKLALSGDGLELIIPFLSDVTLTHRDTAPPLVQLMVVMQASMWIPRSTQRLSVWSRDNPFPTLCRNISYIYNTYIFNLCLLRFFPYPSNNCTVVSYLLSSFHQIQPTH